MPVAVHLVKIFSILPIFQNTRCVFSSTSTTSPCLNISPLIPFFKNAPLNSPRYSCYHLLYQALDVCCAVLHISSMVSVSNCASLVWKIPFPPFVPAGVNGFSSSASHDRQAQVSGMFFNTLPISTTVVSKSSFVSNFSLLLFGLAILRFILASSQSTLPRSLLHYVFPLDRLYHRNPLR